MDEREYLEQRLNPQIDWYDKKSMNAQKKYKIIKFSTCVLSLSLALIALCDFSYSKIVVAVIGVLISALSFLLNMNQYQELWLKYRATCEQLKYEKVLYFTHSGEYRESSNSFQRFVERCEGIISAENTYWQQNIRDSSGENEHLDTNN